MKNLKTVFAFAGTTIAFFIGSGFATAQEILQYFAAYGAEFMIVVAVSMIIFTYTNLSFIHAGTVCKKEESVYHYYCGKYIGIFYNIFSIIFIFLSYVVMCGGAGATFAQQFSKPAWMGVVLLAGLMIFTVVFGLNGLVNVLGKLGPVIIAFIMLIGIWTVIRDAGKIIDGMALIQNGTVKVIRVGNSSFSSALSYAGFVMLWFCTFMSELGANNDPKEVRSGMLIGSFAIGLTLSVVSLALLANIQTVAESEIPSVVLAGMISPAFAAIFSVITLCGTYTAGVPLLWSAASRYFPDGSGEFRTAVVVLGLSGAFIALFLPYRKLVNLVYGINGYVGIALILFMLFKDIKMWTEKRRDKNL